MRKEKPLSKYRTTLRIPNTDPFNVFAVYFAGLMPAGSKGETFLLISVEYLTSWSLARDTCQYISYLVDFVTDDVIYRFGLPQANILDNDRCFTACTVQNLMEKQVIK